MPKYVRSIALALLIALFLSACGQAATGTSGAAAVNPTQTASTQAQAEAQPAQTGAGAPQPAGAAANLAGAVAIDGSSTVFPITEAVAEEFGSTAPDVRVTVGVSGTGGGFERFCRGETVISNASRPIKASEIEACQTANVEFIELPVAFDGLSVVVNPQNDWATCITIEELKTIWAPEAQGQLASWNQVRPDWPAEPLQLYGAGTDSGTFDYFTEAVVGEAGASRGDYTASEDDNLLVQGVSGERGALGYFGFAYYEENQDSLRLLELDGGSGCVAPSRETINSGTYAPLSRPLFIYVRTDALDRPEVAAFVDFYLQQAPVLADEVGYVALPERAYALATQRVAQRVTGSVFSAGSQIGVSIEELLQLEER